MDTKQFEEQVKKFAAEWRTRLEDLQVQFSLGKMDTADAFEKQKENFHKLVSSLKENLDKAGDAAGENAAAMKTKLDELMGHLSHGKTDGKEMFEEQKKKIEDAMKEVYEAGKKTYHTEFDKMLKMFDNSADAFKTGLEILKLKFALGKMEGKEATGEAKQELDDKMKEMKDNFERMQKMGMENLDEWNKQMKEGYEKMKSFAEGWMKK